MIQRWSACGLLLILLTFITCVQGQPPAAETEESAGRRVYVPVEDLDVVLDHDKQGVILSKAEFLKLAADAKRNLEETPQSPRKVVVSSAQYAARVQDDQVVLSVVIELNQLARGWQMTVLPYRGLAVEGATLDDKPAKVGRAAADGRPLVLLSEEPGKHTLKLELSAALVTVGSDKVAAFGLAPISSAMLQMTLPPGKFLHVDEIHVERPAAADQPASYAVAVGGKAALSLRITDRRTQRDSASLVFAGTAIGLHVAPEERTWRAVTSLSVFGKPIDNLTFVVPKSLDVISVESTGLERWEIGEGPGGNTTTLKLVYRQPFSETRTATFTGVSASVLGQPWSVPTLALPGATSHLVRVLVQHPAALRLQQVEATAVRRVGSDEVAEPDMPGMPDMTVKVGVGQQLHYAAWREDFALLFVTQPRARELQATVATRIDITARELALRASVAVQTRFAPLFDFDLALPVDWTVTDVLVENRAVPWRVVPIEAGLNQVRVLFPAPIPAEGKVNLTLTARLVPGENWPIEDQPLSFKLPEVLLPQVGVMDGRYMIAADDDLDLVPEEVTGLDPLRLSAQELQAATAPRLTYEYQDTRFTGTLKVSRKPVRVAAQTLAYHRLDRETLNSHLEARMVVQGGGLQKLQVALPESAGTNLRFSLAEPPGADPVRRPRITEQTSATAADGERLWNLQFDQRAFGLLWLVVDLTTPRQSDAAASIELPGLRVASADRQNGFVAIEGGPDQQLDITAVDAGGQPLGDVDPADVPVASGYVPHERVVAAYRAARGGFRVTLNETRFDRQAVPTVVCDAARLTSVVGESGQRQHKAEFVLRAVGVQSLRVELPAGANLWATLIDGQPVEVRIVETHADGSPAWIVPYAQGSDPGRPHTAQLFYRTEGESLANSGKLNQVPPRMAAVSGQGETQPIEILAREWTLFHPAETVITSSNGEFEPTEKPTRISLLGQLHLSLSLVSPKDLWQKGVWTAIVGGAIGIFFFAWRRRGMAGAAMTLLVGVILTVGFMTFFTFSGQEHSSSEFYADSGRVLAPASKSIAQDGEFRSRDARDYKVAVGGSVAGGGAMAPMGELAPTMGPPGKADADLADDMPTDGMSNTFGLPARPRKSAAKAMAGSMPRADVQHKEETGRVEFDEAPADSKTELGGGEGFSQNKDVAAVKRKRVSNLDGRSVAMQRGQRDESGEVTDFILGAKTFGKQASTGALLSLAIDLPVTPDSRKTAFRYSGAPAAGSNPALDVEYQNRRALSFVVLAWQAGVLVIFWFARRWSVGVRATLGVLGLVVPLALVSLVPLEVLPHLDGIFLGSLWGLLLWFAIAIVTHRRDLGRALRADLFKGASLFLIASTVACGFGNSTARADDAKPPATAGAPSESEGSVRFRAPTIVIPYDPSQEPLQAARVFLPWEEFLKFWNAAHPDKAARPPAPTDGVVAEALYAVELPPPVPGKKSVAEVRGRFVIHSFRDDQISLALPVGRMPLTQARLDGKSAALVTRDTAAGPELTVVVPTRGLHVLDVKFGLPIELAGTAGKFTLATHPVPAGSLRFTLPANDLNVRVSGGAATFRKVREGEGAVAIVPVDQGGEITVAWAPAQARELAQGIVHVESATALSLGDAGIRVSSSFKYTVRQGTLADVVFSLPPGVLVRQIAGLDLGGWEIAGEGAEKRLKVFLRRPVSDSTLLQFDLFQAQPFSEQTQPVAVPHLVPQEVTRETGTLGVFAERQLTVAAGAASGLAQIDVAQFVAPPPLTPPGTAAPGKIAAPTAPLFAYRFAARPVQLQLLVARQKPQSRGTAEHAVVVGTRKLRLASRIELHLAGAPESEIAVQLPPGYLLYDLKANDTVDYHVETRPGEPNPLLIVELSAPRTGVIELVLDGIVSRAPEDLAAKIGTPVPLGMGELRSALAVWLDRIYTATLEDLTGWKSVDPGELPARLRGLQSVPVQFAFTSNLTGVQPVTLALHRAVPRLSADSLSVIIARDTSVQYLLYLRWNIAAAGANAFVFTTPDWLADRLDFDRSAEGIRIRQVLSEKIAGNRLRWTVSLDEPRTNVATLLAQAILPPDAARISAPAVTFEQPIDGEAGRQFQTLELQHHYLVLVNQSPQRVEQEARDAVEPIPAIDLPIKISTTISDQAAEILRVRDTKGVIGWRVQGVQPLKALPASVNLARMTLVIARDGSWRGEVWYRINNRSRQFLALQMPPQSRILSLFVANRPSRPIDPKRPGETDVVLVPLPKTAAGDLAVVVKLVCAGGFDRPLPKGVQVLQSELDLPAPQVVSQGDFGIPVAATEWTVILPSDIDAHRIEDSNRSNVAESDAGGEELLAWYNELQNLYVVALDESQSKRAQSRAQNNLKQIGLALHNYQELESRVSSNTDNRRQQELLLDLKGKVQQAERQLQAKQSNKQSAPVLIADGAVRFPTDTGAGGFLSNKDVQRELVAENAIDFQANGAADDAEALPQINLEAAALAKSEPSQQAVAKNGGQSRGLNRRDLKQQTAEQSLRLNAAAIAKSDQGQTDNRPAFEAFAGKRPEVPQDVDADIVLEQSNAAAGLQSHTIQNKSRIVASPDGRDVVSGPVGGPTAGGPRLWSGRTSIPSPQAGMMGGMGGGIGVAGAADSDFAPASEGGGPLEGLAGWTTAGGLSLEMAVPQDGQKLTFSKSGGDARLALGLRPRASLEAGFGLAWTVVWLLVALGLIAALGRANAIASVARRLPPLAIGVGLAWYFLLPAAAAGFALIVTGAICFGWQHRRG